MEVFANLVGVSFRGGDARDIVKHLTPDDGNKLSLEADPTNEYDSHAVKVIHNPTEMFVGFLARENNYEVFKALERKEELTIEIVGFENSIKPTLLITSVTPLAHEPEAEDQEPLA